MCAAMQHCAWPFLVFVFWHVFVRLCFYVFGMYLCVPHICVQHCVVGGLVWAPPSAIVLWSSTVTTKATLPLSATIIAAFATLVPFSPP